MSDATQGPEIRIVGYCRACGVGLDEANVRMANGTIYCAEHVPVATPPGPPPPPPPHAEYSPYTAPAPPVSGEGSPGVAFILGMIPGVGAIYNGQYGKGIVHVIILALLFMATDISSGGSEVMFGMLIPAFWFYMAFEAYHTARRKQQGLPVDEFSGLSVNQSKFPVAAVLLIVFGVIFLLDNLGGFQLREVLKFWPVGMIALGLYLLYTRMSGGSDEPR